MVDLKSETQQYWVRHINSWQRSELTQADYCRQHGLAPKRFHYWKQKLELSGVIPQVSRQISPPLSSKTPPKFVPITVNTPLPCEGLRIVLPNGIELRGITPETLSTIEPLMERLQ